MKYKDGIIKEQIIGMMGLGFNSGTYKIQCPKCHRMGDYFYDIPSNQIPKYCCYCKEEFMEEEKKDE